MMFYFIFKITNYKDTFYFRHAKKFPTTFYLPEADGNLELIRKQITIPKKAPIPSNKKSIQSPVRVEERYSCKSSMKPLKRVGKRKEPQNIRLRLICRLKYAVLSKKIAPDNAKNIRK
jgi:hypothetical protein